MSLEERWNWVPRRKTSAVRACVVALVLAGAAGLAGCADISHQLAEKASQAPGIGLPANAPARPEPTAFPAVHDMPPPRNSVTLTSFEQQKLEDDLLAARDKQQASVGLPPQPKIPRMYPSPDDKKKTNAAAKAADPPKMTAPVSSTSSIY